MRFVYIVWFRDRSLPADDQDYEWPTCFVIEGQDRESALNWGDHLARRYAQAQGQDLLSSKIESFEETELPGLETLPVIAEGHEATDSELGW